MIDSRHNNDVWQACLNRIKEQTSQEEFSKWFAPIIPLEFDGTNLRLKVPNESYVTHIEKNYLKFFSQIIYQIYGQQTRLFYAVPSVEEKMPVSASADTTAISQFSTRTDTANIKNPFVIPGLKKITIDPQLNPAYTFANLIEGASNKLARTAGISIANEPGKTIFNPLFVYGQSGVGKTHLANAIGVMAKQLHPEKRVLYVSANTFQVQYTDAVRNNTANDFLNFYQTIDVLIVDDIQEFAGKTGTQNTFFHIFNHLHQSGKQLVLTSDRSPIVMAGLEQRLLTRFKWGLSAEIEKPDFAMRKAILENKIYRDGLDIPANVVDYIAEHVVDSVRDLEGVLVSLMAHSTLADKPLDLQLAEKVIARIVNITPKVNTVERIRDVVCDYFDLSVDAISTKSRKREVVQARQIAMYLSKKLTQSSLAAIGEAIGKRDHATVLHACKIVGDLMETDKRFRNSVHEIEQRLKA